MFGVINTLSFEIKRIKIKKNYLKINNQLFFLRIRI